MKVEVAASFGDFQISLIRCQLLVYWHLSNFRADISFADFLPQVFKDFSLLKNLSILSHFLDELPIFR